jgi:hypothetical protein
MEFSPQEAPGFFHHPLGFFLIMARELVKKKQHNKSKKESGALHLFLCCVLSVSVLLTECF